MQRFRVLVNGSSGRWVRSMKAAFQEKVYFAVVENDDSQDILDQIYTAQPEVVVLFIEKESNGDNLGDLPEQCPQTNLVLVMEDPNQHDLFGLMEKGVCGCLPARLLPRQVVHIVEMIVIGGVVCLPRLNQEHFRRLQGTVPMLENLTMREQEVLGLLYQNLSNKEIAAALYLSESTVKTHLYNIFKKMGVRGRGEVLVTAMKDRRINGYSEA